MNSHSTNSSGKPETSASDRRRFLERLLAGALGVAGIGVPVGASVAALLDPLGRRNGGVDFVKVTTLDSIPEDGRPRKYQVVADRVDGWSRLRHRPVGAVYLRRNEAGDVEAFNVVCPHAGCHVGFRSADNSFHCPCHDSWFALDGSVRGARSASPRALDTLPVELRDNGEVWVEFQNFRTGTSAKIPLA